jgi:hypothetical protein
LLIVQKSSFDFVNNFQNIGKDGVACAAIEQVEEDYLFRFFGDDNSFPQQARERNLTELIAEISRFKTFANVNYSVVESFVAAHHSNSEKKPLFMQKNIYVKINETCELEIFFYCCTLVFHS